MVDDHFSTSDSTWYKSRWQLMFSKNTGSDNQWSYTVFADSLGLHTGNPDPTEIAKNPQDPNKYLTGGTSGAGLIQFNNVKATKELNIGNKYNIQDVLFQGGCSSARRMAFDYLGRPFQGNLKTISSAYQSDRLVKTQCRIVLCKNSPCDDQNITIAVEPQTGYIHIL
jgi:hypothetical protein